MSTTLHLSISDYDQMIARGVFYHLNRKIELIRGELREMNPAGPIHDDLIGYLTHWSYQVINDCGIRIRVQSGLSLAGQQSRPEPSHVCMHMGGVLAWQARQMPVWRSRR